MNPMPALTPMLKEIRLSGILDSLEARNRQAIEDKLAYTDFLALLLQDEVARRSQKKLTVRIRRANFRNQKTLEDFDFSFNPLLNRALILDLATGRYIEEKVAVLIAGPTGTGNYVKYSVM
jgi:DNA replication protein DnaC